MLGGVRPTRRPPVVVAARGTGRRGGRGAAPGHGRPAVAGHDHGRRRRGRRRVHRAVGGAAADRTGARRPGRRCSRPTSAVAGRPGGTVGSPRTGGTSSRRSSIGTGRLAPWRSGEAMESAVDEIGAFVRREWGRCLVHEGRLAVRRAPPRRRTALGGGRARRCASTASADRLVPLSADEVAARVRSPVFRDGAFMPGAATVQPATLARGLRRVLLERGVDDPRGHRRRSRSTASDRGCSGRSAPARGGRRRGGGQRRRVRVRSASGRRSAARRRGGAGRLGGPRRSTPGRRRGRGSAGGS